MSPSFIGHYFQFMEIYRMKKSLLAVAAMTAFAGAAQAQSSVTVYGILDVGYIGSNSPQQQAKRSQQAVKQEHLR
jgi:predicted porin